MGCKKLCLYLSSIYVLSIFINVLYQNQRRTYQQDNYVSILNVSYTSNPHFNSLMDTVPLNALTLDPCYKSPQVEDLTTFQSMMTTESGTFKFLLPGSGGITELFISEYVEGRSLNKCLEIYNGTGATINLAREGYTYRFYLNGNTNFRTIALTGTIVNGDVHVLCHSSAIQKFRRASDQLVGNVPFNGNDAIALVKDGVIIDFFGKLGEDPGTEWGSGSSGTENHTLRRKRRINHPDGNPNDSFDPSVEWTGTAVNDATGLGRHGVTIVPVKNEIADPSSFQLTDTTTVCVEFTSAANSLVSNSTMVLNKPVEIKLMQEIDTSICPGDTIQLGSIDIGANGTYRDTVTNASNCDSIITFNVSVIDLDDLNDIEIEVCLSEADNVDFGDHESKITSSTGTFKYYKVDTTFLNDLIISEYIEGSSNNKCLEIFNGTGTTIDLDMENYVVEFYSNGNTTSSTTIALTGTLAHNDVVVVCDVDADASFLAQADITSGASFFNGDDAVVLSKATVIIDQIGIIGEDPGSQWGSGLTSTQNNTLIRKPNIGQGKIYTTTFDVSDEWIGFANNHSDDLGRHSFSYSISNVSVNPNAVMVNDEDQYLVEFMNASHHCPVYANILVNVERCGIHPRIASIGDPCNCCNSDNIDLDGDNIYDLFYETVQITSNPNETWTTISVMGAQDENGIPLSSIDFVNISDTVYQANFYHRGPDGFNAQFDNGFDTLLASNACVVCTTSFISQPARVEDIALCFEGQKSTEIIPYQSNPEILTEDFETEGLGSRYFISVIDTFTTLNDTTLSASNRGKSFLTRTNGDNIRSSSLQYENVQGEFWFGAADLNKNISIDTAQTVITFLNKEIIGLCDLKFSLYLAEDDVSSGATNHWNVEDYIHFDYSIDGGPFKNLLHIESDGGNDGSEPFIDNDFDGDGEGQEITDIFTRIERSIPQGGDSIQLRITIYLDANDEDIAFDSIRIFGQPVSYNFYDSDPQSGGAALASDLRSYDPMVTRNNSPSTVWVATNCNSCESSALPVTIGIYPENPTILQCAQQVNISLNEDCTIDPLKIGSFYRGNELPIFYDLIVKDNDIEVDLDSIHKYIGDTLVYEVVDTCSSQICWGFLHIEDKIPPQAVSCPCDGNQFTTVQGAPEECIFSCIDSIYFIDPVFMDNCDTLTNYDSLRILKYIEKVEFGCDTVMYNIIWTYFDGSNYLNRDKEICKQTYFVVPVSIESFQWPPYSLELACDSLSYNASPNEIQNISNKGYATPYVINNVNDTLNFVDTNYFCGVVAQYTDQLIDVCTHETKIVREWRLEEECTSRRIDSTRFVIVKDSKGPDFGVISTSVSFENNNGVIIVDGDTIDANQPDVEVDIDFDKIFANVDITNSYECNIDFELPIYDNLTDNCSDPSQIQLNYRIKNIDKYEDIIPYLDENNPRIVRNIPVGSTNIIISATDECGNITEHNFTITASDKALPVDICSDTIFATLTHDNDLKDGGISQIPIHAFDLQSYDECGEVILILGRRTDNKFICGNGSIQSIGTEYLEFCCEDVGQPIEVELTFFDNAGNSVSCNSVAIIQNKLQENLTCSDVTVSCGADTHPDEVGYPLYSSLCNSPSQISWNDNTLSSSHCENTVIRRLWSDSISGQSCEQLITILKNDESSEFDPLTIEWPLAYTNYDHERILDSNFADLIIKYTRHNQCEESNFIDYIHHFELDSTEILGILDNVKTNSTFECNVGTIDQPKWEEPACAVVGMSYYDLVVVNQNQFCKKIKRKWTIIDWCAFEINQGHFDTLDYDFQYVIDQCDNMRYMRLKDNSPMNGHYSYVQEIDIIDTKSPHIQDITIEYSPTPNQCESKVKIMSIATDSCSNLAIEHQTMTWIYELLQVDSGAIETIEKEAFKYSINKPVVYEFIGQKGKTYSVKVKVIDECGNSGSENTEFMIADDLAPTLYCRSISMNVLSDQTRELWLDDLVTVNNVCPDQYDIGFVVDSNLYPSDRTSYFELSDVIYFDCGLVGDNEVEILVIDQNGNSAFCEVNVTISEHECEQNDTSLMQVGGEIYSVLHLPISEVKISNSANDSTMSDNEGRYSFSNIKSKSSLSIYAEKKSPIEDVDIFDLNLLYHHITHQGVFENIYQHIAADVNCDGLISVIDLLEIKQYILGIRTSFSCEKTWIFLDPNVVPDTYYSMGNDSYFIDLPVVYENYDKADFIGVRLGDISGQISQKTISKRKYSLKTLTLDDMELKTNIIKSYPNPFIDNSVLEVYSPFDENVFTLEIRDLNDAVFTSKKIKLNAGVNKIIIDEGIISSSGIYYIVLTNSMEILSHKILKIH